MSSALLANTTGCDELNARRTLQEAMAHYEAGEFEDATRLCDKAVTEEDAPLRDFDIAVHNCALIYQKSFRPGLDTPENLLAANRAAELFGRYLAMHPREGKFIDLMTQTWIDSGQHEKALGYWKDEHAKDRKNVEVIVKVAAIHRMAGEWEEALQWHEVESQAESTDLGKARALKNIGNLIASKLLYERVSIKWQDRLELSDTGIDAMQRAAAFQPEDFEIQQLLGNLFASRGEAHQAAWAQLIDTAHSRYHYKAFSRLKAESEGQQPAPSDAPSNDDAAGGEGGESGTDQNSDGAGEDGAGEAAGAESGGPADTAAAKEPGQ